jgi:hypothetical protein
MKHALALSATEPIMPGVTDGQFYQEMQKIRDLIDARANAIERKLDQHANDDRDLFSAIGNRVLIMETTNDAEKGQSVKRAAGVSLLISIPSGLLGLYELLKIWKP